MMHVRLRAVGCVAAGGAEDLNSNPAKDFAYHLGGQLLKKSSLKTHRLCRVKPLAKLKSKVSKSKAAVLDSARTDSGL